MVHIDERGAGDFVVLLHGAPMSPAHLLPLAERLAKGRRVMVVHLPGYGRSPPLEPHSMDASLAAVEEALVARGCMAAHFVGVGAGAYRAVGIAARGGVRARSIAILAGCVDYAPAEKASIAQFIRMFRAGGDPASFVEELALSPRGRENHAWVEDVRAWGVAIDAENLSRELEALVSAPDVSPALRKLDVPLLARVGSIDALFPPERTLRILDMARDVVVEEVPGVGHALLCEDFPSTVASLERHLARVSGVARS